MSPGWLPFTLLMLQDVLARICERLTPDKEKLRNGNILGTPCMHRLMPRRVGLACGAPAGVLRPAEPEHELCGFYIRRLDQGSQISAVTSQTTGFGPVSLKPSEKHSEYAEMLGLACQGFALSGL